jgi:hypothetical protein
VITPLSDELIIGKWQEFSGLANRLIERVGTDGEFETPLGCAMAGDDSHLGGYQITTAFRMCLMAAADHLHALTSLVVEHQRLHLAAPASLARGAIENGATAFWLIHPKLRDERIEHTLRWYSKNARDQQTAVGDLDIGGTPAMEVIERLERLATARQLNIRAATKGYTQHRGGGICGEVRQDDGRRLANSPGTAVAVLLGLCTWAPVGFSGWPQLRNCPRQGWG